MEIGAYEAKTHLPRLLKRVLNGERFVITKHGRPVAELIPVSGHDAVRIRQAIADARAVRSGLDRRGVQLKELVRPEERLRDLAHDGHRY